MMAGFCLLGFYFVRIRESEMEDTLNQVTCCLWCSQRILFLLPKPPLHNLYAEPLKYCSVLQEKIKKVL